MRLIFVRHGESEHNVKGLIQGQSSISDLSKKGLEQAKKIALRLKDEKIDYIFSSDLQRAAKTTKEIEKFHKTPVIYTKELRERDLGVLENRPVEEFEKALKSSKDGFYFNPQGGESIADLKKRAKNFFDKLIFDKKNTNKTILIVSHGGFINGIIAFLLKDSIEKVFEFKMQNTAVSIFEIDSKGHVVKTTAINCTKHL